MLALSTMHSVDVHRLHGGQWESVDVFVGDEVVRAEPFDAIEIRLSVLWLDAEA